MCENILLLMEELQSLGSEEKEIVPKIKSVGENVIEEYMKIVKELMQ
jgi:hypothetical protein